MDKPFLGTICPLPKRSDSVWRRFFFSFVLLIYILPLAKIPHLGCLAFTVEFICQQIYSNLDTITQEVGETSRVLYWIFSWRSHYVSVLSSGLFNVLKFILKLNVLEIIVFQTQLHFICSRYWVKRKRPTSPAIFHQT